MCKALNFLILVFSLRIFLRLKYLAKGQADYRTLYRIWDWGNRPGYGPTPDNGDKRHIGNIDNRVIHRQTDRINGERQNK